jgi:alpha-tubulin suppressor-like RCC1 family protein
MKNIKTAVSLLAFLLSAACAPAAPKFVETAGVPVSPTPAGNLKTLESGFTPILTPTPTFTPIPPTATPEKKPNLAVSVAAGGSHTCAITKLGALSCWGNNEHGQLGDGTTVNRSTPVEVAGLGGGVKAVALGWGHTCAVTLEGAVKCWGYNKNGELGNGSTADSGTPVDVQGLGSGVTAIAAGDDHTCAVTAEGGLKCWGYNKYGQLGDGSTESSAVPVDVAGVSGGAVGVAAGWGHTCLLTVRGGVMCWGNNENGQLGNGRPEDMRLNIADVSGLTGGVSAIAAYGGHTCAATAEGGLKCWGYNKYGQLGDGTSADRNLPVDVKRIGKVTAVAAGTNHTCVLAGDRAKCWGDNFDGQLGDGTQTASVEPVAVAEDLTAIAAGGAHTCAVTAGGGVRCWGNNSAGQLGDGTTVNRNAPVYTVGWDEWILELGAFSRHADAVESLAFSPDGKLLASGAYDGTVILWDVENGTQLFTIQAHTYWGVHQLVFSPDGATLASSGSDETVKFWSVPDGREIRRLEQLGRTAISPDFKTIASVLQNNSFRLVDLASGNTLIDILALIGWMEFSPDGKTLATGVVDHKIVLWDVATGLAAGTLTGETRYSGPLSFSPDGKWIASASEQFELDGTFGLWSVEQGREIFVLSGAARWVSSVVFSGDGKMMISGSGEGMVKFWEAATGRLLRTLRQSPEKNDYRYSPEAIYSLALSADGGLLAAGLVDGSVRLWRISTPPAS